MSAATACGCGLAAAARLGVGLPPGEGQVVEDEGFINVRVASAAPAGCVLPGRTVLVSERAAGLNRLAAAVVVQVRGWACGPCVCCAPPLVVGAGCLRDLAL